MAANAKLQESIDNLKKSIVTLNQTISKQASSITSRPGTGSGGISNLLKKHPSDYEERYGSRGGKEGELLDRYTRGAQKEGPIGQIRQLLNDSRQLSDIANKKDAAGRNYYSKEAIQAANKGSVVARNQGIAAITDFANKAIGGAMNIVVAGVKARNEIQIRNVKVDREILSKKISLYGDALKKANEVAVSKLTGDITEGAYAAFRNTIEYGLTSMNTSLEVRQLDRTRQLDNTITKLTALTNTAGKAMSGIGGTLTQIPNLATVVIGSSLNLLSTALNATTELEIARLEKEKEILDQATQLRKELNEKIFGFADPMIKLTESVDKMLMTLNEKGYQSARMLGFNANASAEYAKGVTFANEAMSKIGKTYEDMLKAQNAYVSESGRNTLISATNALEISSLSMLYGIDENETGGIVGAMNVFNKSIEDGSDMMFAMYKTANKMGVSNQKFAKDLRNTLKLAERYQFKGGVKGVMEMAAWAQKIRLNMEEVSGALSKMHTGNIEDVITTAARMNVLGGNAALYSDPMAMLFNAYADPQKYMENLNKTVRNFGTVNRVTGETSFNIAEQMRIEQIANTMGVSVESLMNQARQANKADTINRRYGNRFGEYSDYVTQNALWSERRGTFVINVMDEEGRAQEITLDELNTNDKRLENIFPKDNQERLVEYTRRIMSVVEQKRGVESEIQGREMRNVHDDWLFTKKEEFRKTLKEYVDHEDMYAANILDGFQNMLKSQDMQYELMNKMNEQFKESGITMLALVSGMANAEFQNSIDNFGQMIAAFSNENAFIEYIRTVNPQLAQMLDSMNINLSSKKREEYARTGFSKGGRHVYDGLTREQIARYNTQRGYTDDEIDFIRRNAGGDLGLGWKLSRDKVERWLREGILFIDDNGYLIGDDGMTYNSGRGLFSSWGESAAVYNNSKVDDAIITPRGTVYTHPDDMIAAFKPNGEIMNGINSNNSGSGRLEISGTLRLDTGSQSIDLMELVRNNPNSIRRLTEEIIIEANKTKYGGRAEYNPNRFTF